jgi:hypothetical protein
MTDKTLGAYQRHEAPDYADGGVTAALIEEEDGVDAAASRLAAFARKLGVPPEWTTAPAVQARHRSDLRTEHDGTPGQPRIWSPDYKTTETWSTPSLRNVHWSDLVDVTPLAPVRECPDPEQHCDIDPAHALAEVARLDGELHDARAMAALWKETTRELAASRKRLRNAHTYWIGRAGKAEDTLSLVQQQRDQATARAEKAEKERDGYRQDALTEIENRRVVEKERDSALRLAGAVMDSHVETLREIAEGSYAAESRPLTPDAITDEARDRAYRAVAALSVSDWDDMSGVAKGRAMALVEAVITEITRPEPPARPEGAEEIEAILADLPDTMLPATDAGRADLLASRGVRVVGEDDGGDETPDVCPHVGGPGGDCGCPL